MRAILNIAWISLKRLATDKTAAIWMLVVPIVYIFIFGTAFQQQGQPGTPKSHLSVLNQDKGLLSDRLLSNLGVEHLIVDTLTSWPQESFPIRTLVIPDSFTSRLFARQPVTLELRKKADTNPDAELSATLAVRKAYGRLLADLSEWSQSDADSISSVFDIIDNRSPLIQVKTERAGRLKTIPSGFNHQTPATLVMFTMLVLFIYGGTQLLDDKLSGTLRRLQTAPVGFAHLFIGKSLGVVLIGWIQMIILLAAGKVLFKTYYGDAPLALAVLILVFGISVGAIALCIGFLFNTEDKLIGISITSALLLSALGGCWFPLEIAPAWMNQLALFLPSGLAMKAFHRLISYGDGLAGIYPYLIGLLLLAFLFIFLLRWLWYRQLSKSAD